MTQERCETLHRVTARLGHSHIRMDLRRDTKLIVTTNVTAKHICIAVGHNEATIILHPHAARRLIADITAVLDGKDFAYD